MNNSNPFVPQGSLLEQKNKKRARVKVAVFGIFALNILVLTPMLIQGCSRNKDANSDTQLSQTPPPDTGAPTPPPDTNPPAPLPPVGGSNAPIANTTSNMAPPPVIPAPQPAPPPVVEPPVAAAREYVVVKGDSFYSIAKKFNVKMKEIQAANPNITPTKLKVGDKLQIPGGSSMGSASTGNSAGSIGSSDSGDVYVVKSGDSLMKIAKSHGLKVKDLRAANNLKTDKIKVGQKLKVPAKVSAPVADTATPPPAPAPVATPIPSAPAPVSGRPAGQ